MTRFRIRAGCLLLILMMIFCLPAMPVRADKDTSESSEDLPKITVSVSIFENIGHSYLAGPLTLQCNEGSTPADVLRKLCDYAYLDGVTTEEDKLVSVLAGGESYAAVDGESGWVLTIDGQEIAFPDEPEMGSGTEEEKEGLVLENGAALDWIFWVTDEARDATVSGEYTGLSTAVNQSVWKNEYNDILRKAGSWLKGSGRGAASLFSLGSAGIPVDHKYLTSVLKEINLSTPADGAELARNILAVSFSGISAVNVSGRDLIDELSAFPDISRQHAALALLAADCNGYELPEGATNDRAGLLNVILAAQNEDGSFSPERGETGTVTATALSLTALAPYAGDQAVLGAIDRGLIWLSMQRDPVTGGYLDEKGALDCRTTSVVVVALTSLGVRLTDPDFHTEGDIDLLALILTLQQDGGGFSAVPGGEADAAATEAAILAMVAQKSGRSPYLLRSPLTGEGSPVISKPEPDPEPSEEPEVRSRPNPSAG
ncbi:MAG: hypothetical protein IKM31_10095 [Oscillospiraceae bacterium]|nr:hypothetical protein [Oscillospiraceae bacterium]